MNILYINRCVMEKGFTLVELMVVLVIAGVLLSVAGPSFTNLLASNNAQSTAERLSSTLAYARSEAITRSSNIIVCSTHDNDTCEPDANGLDWSNGWLVYVDANEDDALASTELTLRLDSIASLGVDSTATANFICFNSLGEQCSSSSVSVDIFGADGGSDDDSGKTLTVSATGGARVTKYVP